MFFTFALQLAGGSVLPIFLLSVLEVPLIGLVPLTLSPRDPTAGWRDRALSALRALTQTYIWVGWAAYCASLAISYVWEPWRDPALGLLRHGFCRAQQPHRLPRHPGTDDDPLR